jgi:hypothetical protein
MICGALVGMLVVAGGPTSCCHLAAAGGLELLIAMLRTEAQLPSLVHVAVLQLLLLFSTSATGEQHVTPQYHTL